MRLRMRVVALNQYYWPSVAATAQLLTDLCEHVAAAGHDVTVIASRGDYVETRERLPARSFHNGVGIKRIAATGLGRRNHASRLADYGSYYLLAIHQLMKGPAPDLILCLSTPPLIEVAAVALARFRQARLVYWCHDVYPEIAVSLGVLGQGGAFTHLLGLVARHALRRADHVVAISEKMGAVLEERGARNVTVVHNWADGLLIDPEIVSDRDRARARASLGVLENEILVLYMGNIGLAHDFSGVCDAMVRIASNPKDIERIRFAFVGDGVRKCELEATASHLPRLGIAFLPYQAREDVSAFLTCADVHLVCLGAGLDGLMLPSKLYPALASGRPVVFAGPAQSEVSEILGQARCGVQVAPDDGVALAATLVALAKDPAKRAAMGRRARAMFMASFDRQLACQRFSDVLGVVAERRRVVTRAA